MSGAAAAAASEIPKQAIPKLFPKIFHPMVGNGTVFKFLKPYETNPVIAYLNSIYNAAPLFKWSLSIVPLAGIVTGNPPVEQLDLNTSISLTATGCVWFVYAQLIQPQNSGSRSLAAVNFCLATVNGYNIYRVVQYNKKKAAEAAAKKKIE